VIDGSPTAELRALRVYDFAEVLYNLQYIQGFQALMKRMRTAEAEAGFAELQVGRILYINGVDFRFVTPLGQTGADYDLEIRVPGHTICGETKCKISTTRLNVESLAKDLRKAARQLPEDKPGIIFLKFPQEWFESGDQAAAERQTVEAASMALRATARVVSVILYTEPLAHDGTTAMQGNLFKEVPNLAHKFERSPHFRLLRYVPTGAHWDKMPLKWIRLNDLPFGGIGEYRY
jgi:hypothetical protein